VFRNPSKRNYYNLLDSDCITFVIRRRTFIETMQLSRNEQYYGYNQHDATNALKQFLIDQFIKFFFLIDQPNVSKHL